VRLIVQNANHRDSRLDEAWSSSKNNKTRYSNDLAIMYQLSAITDHNDEGKEEDTLRTRRPPVKDRGRQYPARRQQAEYPSTPLQATGAIEQRRKSKSENNERAAHERAVIQNRTQSRCSHYQTLWPPLPLPV
jgi:hypothetical protein